MKIDRISLVDTSKEEKIAILNNPRILDYTGKEKPQAASENLPSPYNKINEGKEWFHLVKLAAKALSENQFSLAEDIVDIIPDTFNEAKAWKAYYRGYIAITNENTILAEEQFSLSLEAKPISWCYYYLAELNIKRDPIRCHEYFSLSLQTDPILDDEQRSRAINWINDFFNQEVYLRLNPDLRSLQANSLFEHYKHYGIKEGRLAGATSIKKSLESMVLNLPKAFKWEHYLNANLELRGLIAREQSTILEAEYILTKHFLDHGKAENRSYTHTGEVDLEHASEELYQNQKDYIARKARIELDCFLGSSETIEIGEASEAIITIIMIVHNKAEYTLQAIESIKASKLKSVSLIVVDNNSTDSTQKLLSKLIGNVTAISNDSNVHFLRSVNQALPYVRTPYFCLLNNDAFLERATLSETVSCLKRYSDSAIVGGLVLHADGYIQDAGSIVFSDGSCRGLGRRMPPNHHLFNFEHSVDYVSGAFLATTLSTMQRLGGFDERYSPAYYEETDLCFRAHSLNIPVIYSPSIVIRHIEYGSSSTSEQVIAQMTRNKVIFRDSHCARLNNHLHPSDYIEDDIVCLLHGHLGNGPKILFIDDRIPQANLGSGFSRAIDILHEFKELTAFVSIFAKDYKRSISSSTHLPRGAECIEGDRGCLLSLLNARNDFYDYIFVSREHNQRLLLQIKHELEEKDTALKPRIIFDAESLFSIRNYTYTYLQKHGSALESLSGLDLGLIATEELQRFAKADIITSVSELEYSLLSKEFPEKSVFLLGHPFPNLEEQPYDLENRDAVTFLGAVHEEVSPNHDSLVWMRDEILPAMKALPGFPSNLKILIAGNVTCTSSQRLISEITSRFDFVEYLGLVDDLIGLFSRTRLFIAPTRYAAGVPHKIHLASSFGVPTVATSIIAEQMGWNSKKAIVTADTGPEFAQKVTSCYENYTEFEEARQHMLHAFRKDCSHDFFKENLKKIISVETS